MAIHKIKGNDVEIPEHKSFTARDATRTFGKVFGDHSRFPLQYIKVEDGFNSRLPVDQLDPETAKARTESDDELYQAIIAGNRIPPIEIYHPQGQPFLYVVDGHRRLAQYQRAVAAGKLQAVDDLHYVPAIVVSDLNDVERKARIFTSNKSSFKLNPIEVATTFKAMLRLGATEESIAKMTGSTIAFVKQHLALGSLPQVTQDLVRTGVVTKTTALNASREVGAQAAAVQLNNAAKAKIASGVSGKDVRVKPSAVKVFVPKKQQTIELFSTAHEFFNNGMNQDARDTIIQARQQSSPDAVVTVNALALSRVLKAYEDANKTRIEFENKKANLFSGASNPSGADVNAGTGAEVDAGAGAEVNAGTDVDTGAGA